MTTVTILDAALIDRLLDPVALRRGLERAMAELSAGRADVPPRVAADTGSGFLAAMPGHLPGVGLAAKLVTVFPGNVTEPSHQGVIVVFDEATGTPLAIMDAEVITGWRTAMTAAIAADLLAAADAAVLTVIGAGTQARRHVEAFAPLRDWDEIRLANRSRERAEALAVELAGTGIDVVVAGDPSGALDGADVVALCTHAPVAVIDPDRVAPGVHVSSVGSAAELPRELAASALVVVEWRDCVVVPPPAGAAELQGLDRDAVVELGDVIAGRAPGRTSADQITVYKSTGHAVQDVAAARIVADAAAAAGIGATVSL